MPEGRVLVTGGASGIGAAVVRSLAAAGYEVDFTYFRSRSDAETLVSGLDGGAGRLRAWECDLSRKSSIEELLERVDEAGTYYGLVHNAGISHDQVAALVDPEKARPTLDVNFWAFVHLVRGVVRGMSRARSGRIVAISSVTARLGIRGNSVYAASKAALAGYVRNVVNEVARKRITINLIEPGYVDTPMLAPYASHREAREERIPAGRYGQPGEIAAVVSFLLSEASAYVNGAIIPVDGGLSASLGVTP